LSRPSVSPAGSQECRAVDGHLALGGGHGDAPCGNESCLQCAPPGPRCQRLLYRAPESAERRGFCPMQHKSLRSERHAPPSAGREAVADAAAPSSAAGSMASREEPANVHAAWRTARRRERQAEAGRRTPPRFHSSRAPPRPASSAGTSKAEEGAT